jgi:predicted dienelactone hydrolase
MQKMKSQVLTALILSRMIVAASFESEHSTAASSTTVHRMEGITPNPDHTVSLSLGGVVPKTFSAYYDLYPVEASTKLIDWTAVATLQRKNDSNEALLYTDASAAKFQRQFYRTSSNFYVTPFTKPSGPYAVGTFSRAMTDPSRLRDTVPRTNSFMVKFWYPAEAKAGAGPAPYVDPKLTLVPTGEGNLYWPNPGTVSKFVAHALPDVPVATNQTSYPVLLYSHGLTRFREQNTDTLEEMASHGYIVIAMDHTDAFGSVFPSGEVIRGKQGIQCEDINTSMLDYRSHELVFVMDELSNLNAADSLLAGRLDLDHLGLIGKSVGGMTVAHVGQIDKRCKAVVLLDAGITLEVPSDLTAKGLQKPFLSMSSTMGRPPCPGEWLSSSLNLFAAASSDAYWCQILNSSHNSFDDRGSVLNDVTGMGNPTPASRAISLAVRACALSFFNKYLKNQDDHLLDNPAIVHTNIINFKRK